MLNTEANDIKTKSEATIVQLQQESSESVRNERAIALVSSKRQREKHAKALRLADDEAQAALKLEQSAWQAKHASLEQRLRQSHAEVLRERQMWLLFREELLKEKAVTDDRYYAVKSVCHERMQEQLDQSIEVERRLLADINEMTEYTSLLETKTKSLERERRKARRAAKHWRKRAEKAVVRLSNVKEKIGSKLDDKVDAQKLRIASARRGN